MTSSALAAARSLQPLIRAHRNETEANRRLAAPIVERLIEMRLCRMALGEELGGLATPGVEALRVYETLAEAEASVPWIVWNASLVAFFARFLPEPARKEVFADPDWLYAQSTNPAGTAEVDGDAYRLSGRWPLVSGCELADWIAFHARIVENGTPRTHPDGSPVTRFFFARRDDCEILDTWHVGGLRGTGSHDVVLDGLRVPNERSFDLFGPAEPMTSVVGRVPIFPNVSAILAAQMLGVAQGALDTLTEMARKNVTPGPMPDLRDRPPAQSGVALHAAAVRAARSHLHETTETIWTATERDRTVLPEEKADVYAAANHAMLVARAAVDALHGLGGTRALYTHCPLERAHRDLHAMLRHIVASPALAEDAGRMRFGLEPVNPFYGI